MSERDLLFSDVRQKLRDATSAYGDGFTHAECLALYNVVEAATEVLNAVHYVYEVEHERWVAEGAALRNLEKALRAGECG